MLAPRRSRAREIVLQVLYEDDLNPDRNLAAADQFLSRRLQPPVTASEQDRQAFEELLAFARGLLAGVRKNRGELDSRLDELADNWRISRMAVTDRNVLRLAAYEMLFTDTPGAVAIDEAVELAKRFGAKQSPHFVNGILDRLWRSKEEDKGREK